MYNIYLDSTELYNDPFFNKALSKKLLYYSEKKIFQIYISNLVLQETRNNLDKNLNKLKKENSKNIDLINRISIDKFDPIDLKIESILEKFDTYYDTLSFEKKIVILDNKNNCLEELIYRSLQRIKPFSENKEEFRDGIIWLTYLNHIETNQISDPVFITNNTREFYKTGTNDKECHIQEFHSDLQKEAGKLILFSSINKFFEYCSSELSPLFTEKEKQLQFLKEYPLSKEKIKWLIEKSYRLQLINFADNYIRNLSNKEMAGIDNSADIESPNDVFIEIFDDFTEIIDDMGIAIKGALIAEIEFGLHYYHIDSNGFKDYTNGEPYSIELGIDFSFTYKESTEIYDLVFENAIII